MDFLNFCYFWNIIQDKRYKRLIRIIVLMIFFTVMPVGYHIIVLNVPAKTIQSAIRCEMKSLFDFDISQGTLDILW